MCIYWHSKYVGLIKLVEKTFTVCRKSAKVSSHIVYGTSISTCYTMKSWYIMLFSVLLMKLQYIFLWGQFNQKEFSCQTFMLEASKFWSLMGFFIPKYSIAVVIWFVHCSAFPTPVYTKQMRWQQTISYNFIITTCMDTQLCVSYS